MHNSTRQLNKLLFLTRQNSKGMPRDICILALGVTVASVVFENIVPLKGCWQFIFIAAAAVFLGVNYENCMNKMACVTLSGYMKYALFYLSVFFLCFFVFVFFDAFLSHLTQTSKLYYVIPVVLSAFLLTLCTKQFWKIVIKDYVNSSCRRAPKKGNLLFMLPSYLSILSIIVVLTIASNLIFVAEYPVLARLIISYISTAACLFCLVLLSFAVRSGFAVYGEASE